MLVPQALMLRIASLDDDPMRAVLSDANKAAIMAAAGDPVQQKSAAELTISE
jgi:hypothetical protein